MKDNRSWSQKRKDFIAQAKKAGIEVTDIEFRRIGTTTGQALSLLGQALLSPNEVLKIIDHHGTRAASKNMMKVMQQIQRDLSLEGIVYNLSDLTVVYDLKGRYCK